MKYKTKNFSKRTGAALQYDLACWLESRDHITITSTSIWSDGINHYATVIYMETNYVG